jgi:hypothetical protein
MGLARYGMGRASFGMGKPVLVPVPVPVLIVILGLVPILTPGSCLSIELSDQLFEVTLPPWRPLTVVGSLQGRELWRARETGMEVCVCERECVRVSE